MRARGTAWLRPIRANQEEEARRLLAKSPFGPLVAGDCTAVRHRVGEESWSVLSALRPLEEDGFVDYLATVTELPDGARQVISIATRAEGGFAADVEERLRLLSPSLALALYGIYQAQLAQQVATTYLGQRTGSLVLEGQMGRGRSASLRAGIGFLDIRGFTSLSHELGVEAMVPLLNAVFEAIDDATRPLGGEILKLIGDAALVVFPLEEGETPTCWPSCGACSMPARRPGMQPRPSGSRCASARGSTSAKCSMAMSAPRAGMTSRSWGRQ